MRNSNPSNVYLEREQSLLRGSEGLELLKSKSEGDICQEWARLRGKYGNSSHRNQTHNKSVKRGTALYNVCLVDSTAYCINNHPSEHFIALHTYFPLLASVVVSVAVKPSAEAALKAAPVSEF